MTLSVVARDPDTGELGAAVASAVLAVGRAAVWARAGVGVVATQSRTRRGYGPHALDGLAAGLAPAQVLSTLLSRDVGAAHRQVAVVGADGWVAAHTGTDCLPVSGHRTGDGWSVQGNTLAGERVLAAMAAAVAGRLPAGTPLAERLLGVLAAGERAGGDLRGRQSAALLVVGPDPVAEPWDAVPVDLRVDDAADPVAALGRLLALQRAYEAEDLALVGALSESERPDELHDVLLAARRGDVAATRRALDALRRRPGWDEWLRSRAVDHGLAGLLEEMDSAGLDDPASSS